MCFLEILISIVIGLVTGLITSYIISWRFFKNKHLPEEKIISLKLKAKNKSIKGKIFGDYTYQKDGILFFNGKNNYIDCGKQEFKLPITIKMEFKLNKINEWWATLFGWNNVEQPHDGIQIALERDNKDSVPNKIVARVGNGTTGDIKSNVELDKDREWHSLILKADKEKLSLNVDDNKKEQDRDIWSPVDKKYQLYIGKSFLNEFFNGCIKDFEITQG